jgi:hypothetical protein
MTVPVRPKIYHIAHVDRLSSIIGSGGLWCDAEVVRNKPAGTTIGMNSIKERRLHELTLSSHPDLHVGGCVPFYFCPRSVMLYLIHRADHPELSYRGGQGPILHFEADLLNTVEWANVARRRWAFTLSNAGSKFFEDRASLDYLGEIEWSAVQARNWSGCKDGKQAEFLIEKFFPWQLIERVGVSSRVIYQQVANLLPEHGHRPALELCSDWYY